MSTAIAKPAAAPPAKVSQWLQVTTVRVSIQSALGGVMEVDYFLAQMVISFEKTPEIAACSAASKFAAAHICATYGLLPTLNEVALIPRKGELTVMPQWQGYHTLMMRADGVKSIRSRLIHATDTYTFDADTEQLRHTYDPFAADRTFNDFKDIKGGYLVIEFDDGRPTLYHCVSLETIKKARRCAQSDNVWKSWFQEQCLKTLYRNAFARRVIHINTYHAAKVAELIRLTDAAEGNSPNIDEQPQAPVTPVTTSRTERLKEAKRPAPEPVAIEQVEDTLPEVETPEPPVVDDDIAVKVNAVRQALKLAVPSQEKRAAIYAEIGIEDPTDDSHFDLYSIGSLWDRISEINEGSKE